MAKAVQYVFRYAAVPLAAPEPDNSTTDVPNENPYSSHQDTTGWGLGYDRVAVTLTQTTRYAVERQWQQRGQLNGTEYHRYIQAVATSDRWNDRHSRNQNNAVAVPQAVYYGGEGSVRDGNGTHDIEQPMGEIWLGSTSSNYMRQQHIQPTPQVRNAEGNPGAPPTQQQHSILMSPKDAIHGQSDEWQHENALEKPVVSEAHPRQDLGIWKWRLMLIASNIISLLNGYDISNVANIQGPMYEAYGNLTLLPWVALSYSLCNVVTTPLARKLYKFYNIKVLTLSGLAILILGNALAAAAPTFVLFIIGRAIMAFGASIIYQGVLSFSVIFSYPGEISLVQASFGASFSFGLLTGPVIGAGFAQNEHATWRWSFYLTLPIIVVASLLCIVTMPSYSVPSEKSVSRHLKEIDWVGHILHSSTFISFGLATVFSGSAWPWGSAPQLASWVIFVAAAVAYIVQQTFSIGIKPERRILPIHLLEKRIVLLTFLCTLGAAITYGVTLYYTPLFYIFTHEMEPLEAGLRLLSFTALFIFTIFISHATLPLARYYMPFFVFGGALLLGGGVAYHTITSVTPLATVTVFSGILGAGVGVLWNLAIPACSAVLETQEDRLDQTTLHSVAQLGGTAISLSISASIYRNIGLKMVKDAVGFTGFTDTEIIALLSGVKSTMLEAFSPEVRELVIAAIVTTISQIYYIIIAGAALCFVASLFLKFEPLRFEHWIMPITPEKGGEKDVEAYEYEGTTVRAREMRDRMIERCIYI
ncbi:major facilitator superfamily domain-containing protein [Nemania sp. NC0429]|nr:major facilitator superfamily domain-containing protein [Nemania sp. NC0429]